MDGEKRRHLEERFVAANRHVMVGRVLVQRQRTTIADQRIDPDLFTLATELLAELERSLRLHTEERDRLRKELARLSNGYSVAKGPARRSRGHSKKAKKAKLKDRRPGRSRVRTP
jgi:hypothetical protein